MEEARWGCCSAVFLPLPQPLPSREGSFEIDSKVEYGGFVMAMEVTEIRSTLRDLAQRLANMGGHL
jgi:hypothetical protein